MLATAAADTRSVIHRALVFLSIVSCAFVFVSFLLFARDQTASASKHQTSELVAGPGVQGTSTKAHKKAQPRRFIDDAAHTLTSPFDSIVRSKNPWVSHGIPALLALLVYGPGLGFLARVAQPSL